MLTNLSASPATRARHCLCSPISFPPIIMRGCCVCHMVPPTRARDAPLARCCRATPGHQRQRRHSASAERHAAAHRVAGLPRSRSGGTCSGPRTLSGHRQASKRARKSQVAPSLELGYVRSSIHSPMAALVWASVLALNSVMLLARSRPFATHLFQRTGTHTCTLTPITLSHHSVTRTDSPSSTRPQVPIMSASLVSETTCCVPGHVA